MTAAFTAFDKHAASPLFDTVGPLPFRAGSDLRVALFSGNYNYVKDGANQALNRLVDYLERQGVTVRVYSPTVKEPAFEPKGTLISVPSIPIPLRKEYRLALGLSKATERDLDAFQPDIVHISAPDLLGQKAIAYARRRGLPVVASVHTRFETYLKYYHLGWLEPYLQKQIAGVYNKCDEIYVPTDCMADVMRASGVHVPVKLWSRGVETDLYRPDCRDETWRAHLGVAPDEVLVSFVGRLVMEKGLEPFAATLDLLKSRGVPVKAVVVGDGPARSWFEGRLPSAKFIGFQKGEALARAYASSDIFFNPSCTEAFGNVTLEAMSAGVPQVCADATGSRFLVRDGETGFLVAPDNVASYADRIAELAADRGLRQRLAVQSRRRGLEFQWDAILSAVHSHYQLLMPSLQMAAE